MYLFTVSYLLSDYEPSRELYDKRLFANRHAGDLWAIEMCLILKGGEYSCEYIEMG